MGQALNITEHKWQDEKVRIVSLPFPKQKFVNGGRWEIYILASKCFSFITGLCILKSGNIKSLVLSGIFSVSLTNMYWMGFILNSPEFWNTEILPRESGDTSFGLSYLCDFKLVTPFLWPSISSSVKEWGCLCLHLQFCHRRVWNFSLVN